ncbi:MAG TPA: hypothetical protein PLI17_13395 [Denitromonas sp.]|nr:hypothetical protein [Denitromonas sp.]
MRLPEQILARASKVGAARGLNRSETLRQAVIIGLPLLEANISPDIRRLVLLLENLNLGVTMLLDKEHSDMLDRLVEVAEENLETYHG